MYIYEKQKTKKNHVVVKAYAITTMFMSVTVLGGFNPRMFYQFLVSVDYANFGQYTNQCSATFEDTEDTEDDSISCTDEISDVAYAYYYLALIIFLTLGRSNRMSFLWRTIGEICDKLVEIQNKYSERLTRAKYSEDRPGMELVRTKVGTRKTTQNIDELQSQSQDEPEYGHFELDMVVEPQKKDDIVSKDDDKEFSPHYSKLQS